MTRTPTDEDTSDKPDGFRLYQYWDDDDARLDDLCAEGVWHLEMMHDSCAMLIVEVGEQRHCFGIRAEGDELRIEKDWSDPADNNDE